MAYSRTITWQNENSGVVYTMEYICLSNLLMIARFVEKHNTLIAVLSDGVMKEYK